MGISLDVNIPPALAKIKCKIVYSVVTPIHGVQSNISRIVVVLDIFLGRSRDGEKNLTYNAKGQIEHGTERSASKTNY